MKRLLTSLTMLSLGLTTHLGAQVGSQPAKSPFLDVYTNHELAIVSGWWYGGHDPAGVAPRDGMLVGARYGWHAGGPAILSAELDRMDTKREVKDPTQSAGQGRELGEKAWPLYALNLGLDLALTGEKTWHQLMPEVKGGVGFVSDLKSKADSGGFKFGTRFAIDFGAGIRWVPAGRWGLRADLDSRAYSVGYPTSYYVSPTSGGGSPILAISGSKSAWTWNPSLSLGLTYNFGR